MRSWEGERGKMRWGLFKIFFVLVLLGLGGTSLVILWVIATAPLERMERIKPLEDQASFLSGTLEEGALVDASQLECFLQSGEQKKRPRQWIAEQIEEKKLEIAGKGRFLLKEQVHLPRVWKNDCASPYCLQRRIPFNEIPSLFWKSLIGIEDYRFLNHAGVDFRAIVRALITDIVEMRLAQGGSTITQQLVKNLFYSSQKSFSRKIKEIILSFYLESLYEKENILEAYLNEFEWGSFQGLRVKGLYAASLMYFGKTPDRVEPFEAAILIGLLKGPYYYSPFRRLNRLKKRSAIVFRKLIELNFVSSTALRWREKHWKKWHQDLLKRKQGHCMKALWWAKKNRKLSSPLVQTSKNSDSQRGSFSLYERYVFIHKALGVLKELRQGRARGRLLSLKAYFGNILNENSFRFYSKYERAKKKALERERHQVGSTLKPILYSYYFSAGKNPGDFVETSPLVLNLKSGEWSAREVVRDFPEEVTLEEALLKSYNRPVIHLAQEIGFKKVEEYLLPLIPRLKTPLAQYPAQLLGAVELSLRELFQVYKQFFLKECASSSEGSESEVEVEDEGERSADTNVGAVVRLMSDPTQTTIRNWVGESLGKLSFFGKTGTSNQGYDNWFVSFDGFEIGLIWVGLEEGRGEGEKLNLSGSSTAFQVFKRFSKVRGKRFNELICQWREF